MDKLIRLTNRVKKLSELKAKGVNVYPKFWTTINLKKYIEKYSGLADGECLQEKQESVAGRIMSFKTFKNSTVYNLLGGGETIQIKAEAGNTANVMQGDIVGVKGFPGKGNLGQLMINSKQLDVLSPCLYDISVLPKSTHFSPGSPRDLSKYSLKQQLQLRPRFINLNRDEDIREIFETRSKIISYIRRFLDDLDFLEVETPILNTIRGAGAVHPFVTYSGHQKLYLRVAPEINLKKLVVGGFDRVYEIGKQFRNEGIDRTHHPEFTSCEFYMTYADCEDMMALTEELLSGLVKELTGTYVIQCPSNDSDLKPVDIDFTPPFRRMDFLEELLWGAGLSIPEDLGKEETNLYLRNACERFGVKCHPPLRTGRLLDKLADHFLVPNCVQPTFYCQPSNNN